MPDVLRIKARLRRPGPPEFTLDLELEVPPGITVVAGPSGAGKSTLLGVIAGLEPADDARVTLGERVLPAAPHARRVALVPQSLALFPHLSVLDNVSFGVDRKLPRAERESRALANLERMRVARLGPRKPATLSGGEAQRVALARAFASAPRALLLDEPFSSLDHELRRELVGELRLLSRELDIPFLHVTHDRGEAKALASRVYWLEHGRVTRQGTLDEAWPEDDLAPRLREVR